uniref:EamA-like transporter family protein n=1 Tax=Megaviridae environmental sample TaxID=1737588 RepID=A0A5J6VLR5_9VIRU|nr:MAG: EamA-like transporter family protein [Megaviridae environmental sample]
MNWIFYSFLGAIVFTFWNILTKISTTLSTNRFSFILQYIFIAIIINVAIAYLLNIPLFFERNAFASGLFGAFAVVFITNSIHFCNNSGLPLALLRTQIVYTTLANIFMFDTTFDIHKLINILLIVVGVCIISFSEVSSKIVYNNWILLAILSGVFSTLFDIYAKKANLVEDNTIYNINFNNLVSECFFVLLINLIIIRKSIFVRPTNKMLFYTLLSGALYFLYTLLLMTAFNEATNVGYVKAIITSSIVFTIFLNYLLFHKTISTYSWIGITLILMNIYCLIL